MRWLTLSWWRYLFTAQTTYAPGSVYPRRPVWVTGWRHFLCRVRDHPCGVWWYTGPTADEPDMTCRECGDDLG